jgi:DNA-binding transcriptional MocR family regulator
VTSGAQGAISLTARLLLRGGDRVLVESPTYPNALDTFRAQQARPVPVPMDEDGWADGAFESTLTQLRPRLAYIVPHFQNPTGLVMDEERQASIARAARRAGAWLLADETMTDTGIGAGVTAGVGPGRPMPFAASVGPADAERVLVCGSLAKSFWGGLRVGWLRAPSRVVHELAATRAALDIASPILDQLAGLAVLRGEEGHLEGHRRQWIEQRGTLMRAVDATFPEWEYRVPDGGLCLWVRMDRDDATTLAHRAQTHGLLVHAGPRFGTDPGTFERYIRLPYTLPSEQLEEAVRRLALARQVTGPMAMASHRSDLVA